MNDFSGLEFKPIVPSSKQFKSDVQVRHEKKSNGLLLVSNGSQENDVLSHICFTCRPSLFCIKVSAVSRSPVVKF